ncbi:MAG: 50S ribosomal protein L6 [Elusimicrobia bacterium]|nr:50S ribosomal protein L6 [Elusimicrobiota bacterium]
MSRVGRQPIAIPEGVEVALSGTIVRVKGPGGELSFQLPPVVQAEKKDDSLLLKADDSDPGVRALYGTARTRVANMVHGVKTGFSKAIVIEGLGFKAEPEGEKLMLSIGYSHRVAFPVPKGIKVGVDKKQTTISLSGADKELVGETAARLRALRPPEPYKGTGIRYQGERIQRKAGKTAAGAGVGVAGAAGVKK